MGPFHCTLIHCVPRQSLTKLIRLLGNAILRAAFHAHYTDNVLAAAIGAIGGILAWICYITLSNIVYNAFHIPMEWQDREPIYVTWPLTTATMTLAGVLGVSVLKHYHVDIGDIDLVHGARAGALGGALLAPVILLSGIAVFLALGILASPLWAAMLLGFRWAYARTSETWTENTYRTSYCYSYGSCGDDPDIQEEMGRAGLRPGRGSGCDTACGCRSVSVEYS